MTYMTGMPSMRYLHHEQTVSVMHEIVIGKLMIYMNNVYSKATVILYHSNKSNTLALNVNEIS